MKYLKIFEEYSVVSGYTEYYKQVHEMPDMEQESISQSEYEKICNTVSDIYFSESRLNKYRYKLENSNISMHKGPFFFRKYKEDWWLVILDTKKPGFMPRWFLCDQIDAVIKLLTNLKK